VTGRKRWPETAQYNYRRGTHRLELFYSSPSATEVTAIRTGPCEFALYARQPLLVLCFRFKGAGGWSDAPYSWHLLPEEERDLPSADLEEEKRAMLQVVLVDAATGIVRAIRMVSLSPEFTRALHAAIREQASAPWDSGAYDRALDELYQTHPSTDALVAAAAARSSGGA